jgi:YbbR domain-containing protein
LETQAVNWTDVSESISTKVQLQPLKEPRLLAMDVEEVEVQLDVMQVESRDFKIRVDIPDKVAYRKWIVSPEEVVVTVKATGERLEKIVEADISCTVDARAAKKDDRLKVVISRKPKGIADIKCRPEEVRVKAR